MLGVLFHCPCVIDGIEGNMDDIAGCAANLVPGIGEREQIVGHEGMIARESMLVFPACVTHSFTNTRVSNPAYFCRFFCRARFIALDREVFSLLSRVLDTLDGLLVRQHCQCTHRLGIRDQFSEIFIVALLRGFCGPRRAIRLFSRMSECAQLGRKGPSQHPCSRVCASYWSMISAFCSRALVI
jgi:hypothetical protein